MEPDAQPTETRRVPRSAIIPNPLQPRRVFSDAELADLASSIRENGLLQPIVVRPVEGQADRFEIVVGERRFRAISQLGWEEVPVIVREASNETLLVLALVENLQREALNPIEEAEGYLALSEQFDLTHADIARAVGKDRSTVANVIRLLRLPPSVRGLVEGGALSQGHARALLTLEDDVQAADLARRAASEGWSVREVERRVAKGRRHPRSRQKPKPPVVQALEQELADHLMTRVDVSEGRGGVGRIQITYHGPEDFERIFELITGRPVAAVVDA